MTLRKHAVALESGTKRVFAVAIDWPGWARRGRDEDEALAALLDYAGRYARVVGEGSLTGRLELDVTERLQGGSGTDFGVPGTAPAADARPLDAEEAGRQAALLRAAWAAFDRAAAGAVGKELRLGPRGGGRNLDKMIGHVLEAEEAYLHQLGRRRPRPAASDRTERMEQVREAALAALAARARGEQPEDPNQVRKQWSPRYFVRRSAWHALDHAWEIEDRLP